MLKPGVGTTVFGRYLLEKELAQGAMGSVWIAVDKRLERAVALKTLVAAWATVDEARARFEREAMAVARLHSPYIVQVFDYGIDNDCPFIVMELLKGEDLDARLKKLKRIGLWDFIPILVQTCKALSVAHQAGIIHRDLKPGNLFLVRSEEEEIVKVLDFGVAKALPSDDQVAHEQEATRAGTLLGTPVFMSPEQSRGVRGIDHRADLWSLGVIAFRALTGRLPFVGKTVADTIVQICAAPLPKATDFAPDLPPEVDAFFARALTRDPAGRFKTAREMATAFARIAPRESYPAITLPGLPGEMQHAALEKTPRPGLAQSAPTPRPTAGPVIPWARIGGARPVDASPNTDRGLGTAPPRTRPTTKLGLGVQGFNPIVEAFAGTAAPGPLRPRGTLRLGGGPLAATPGARIPLLESEKPTYVPPPRPAGDRDEQEPAGDDGSAPSVHEAVRERHGAFAHAALEPRGAPFEIDDEETRERGEIELAAGLAGEPVVEDETTTDRSAAPRADAAAGLGDERAERTPPPLPPSALVGAEPTDPAAPLAGASLGSGAASVLRESHGTLGSQSIDTAEAVELPKKRASRLGLALASAAAVVAVVAGGVYGLSSRAVPDRGETSDPAATRSASPGTTAPVEPPTTGTPEPPATSTGEPAPPDTAGLGAGASAAGEPTALTSTVATATAPPATTVARPGPPSTSPPPPPRTATPPRATATAAAKPPEEDTYGSRY